MARPAISVLVPVWNEAAYVDQTLSSVAAQSFEDFEVVIADDGSTDATPSLCEAWVKRDPRFRLVENRDKLGMTGNWNRALAAARGEFVAKLDGDDVMRPRFLETLLEELRSDDGVDSVFCRTLTCNEHMDPVSSHLGDQALYRFGCDPLRRHVKPGLEWYRFCFDGFQIWSSNSQMHRTEMLRSIGGWDERWGCASDTDLILRILERDTPVVHVPYVGTWYRKREGSVSHSYDRDGWKAIEGILVHLMSLNRFARTAHSDRRLWKTWYVYWERWLSVREQVRERPDALPPGVARQLETVEAAARPTSEILFSFWARRIVTRAHRLLRRSHGAVPTHG